MAYQFDDHIETQLFLNMSKIMLYSRINSMATAFITYLVVHVRPFPVNNLTIPLVQRQQQEQQQNTRIHTWRNVE